MVKKLNKKKIFLLKIFIIFVYIKCRPGKATLETSIKLFYGEKKFYDYEKTRCMPGRVCGHYTQVVWATTTHLGCAVHVCEPLKFTTGNTWKKAEFHVCNYAEG